MGRSLGNGLSCSFQGDPGEDGKPVSLLFFLSQMLSWRQVRPTDPLGPAGGYRRETTRKMQLVL